MMRVIPELTNEEYAVLELLLEFHADNDEPGEHYPDKPFRSLCVKCGVRVPPAAGSVSEASDHGH